MSERRFQVFVSSTFTDLREARQHVQQALLQLDCFPAGMELFPASDEEQWEFIKRVIDDCDYYIVLVAGRYGSTTAEGVSFTEMEFDYAVASGIPVLAFLHADPESIPVGQSELDSEARRRLIEFRAKVSQGRLIKTWTAPAELAGLVALSLTKLSKTHPRPGWVRGPTEDTTDLLRQLNDLRHRNDDLQAQVASLSQTVRPSVLNLAPTSSVFALSGAWRPSYDVASRKWSVSVTWDEMLSGVGPELLQWQNDSRVNSELASSILAAPDKTVYEANVNHEVFKTVRMQFLALKWTELAPFSTKGGSTDVFWRLTAAGRERLLHLRTVKEVAEAHEATA